MIEVLTPIRRADPMVLALLRRFLGPSLAGQHEEFVWKIGLPDGAKKRFSKAMRELAAEFGAELTGEPLRATAPAAILIRPNCALSKEALAKLTEIAAAKPGRSLAFAFEHGVDYHFATGLVRQKRERSGTCPAALGRAAQELEAIAADDLSYVATKEPMWLRCVSGPEPPWELATEVQRYFGCDLCGPLDGSR